MHNNWREGNPGRVYRLHGQSGHLHQILSDNVVNLPNGMAWDEGKRLMYFADTGEQCAVWTPRTRLTGRTHGQNMHANQHVALWQYWTVAFTLRRCLATHRKGNPNYMC